MWDTTANATAPVDTIGSYIEEKRRLVAEIERDMAITYRTFTKDLIEPLRDCEDFFEDYLSDALEVVQTPGEFAMDLEPERITALTERYRRFCHYPAAVMPLTVQSCLLNGVDRAGHEYDIEEITFVPEAFWRAIADAVEMPATSKVHVAIHYADPIHVEVSVPDLPLLDIEHLRRFKAAFEREWHEAKFYAQMTYNEFFVDGA
jgi:hypothetical protein